jgi:hypothetical protein
MLARSGLSKITAAVVKKSAMSESHRKFAGPYRRQ